ncbi:MAG: Respiratory nitrate reductase 1 beta chain [Chlamydiae bacterium]|nr:Respiratory nitrate reductase 1 beta chain [Chlamydiota bacterium]
MRPRAQIATLFHLDKCIGCHTCSIACKNIWTDRKGAEYMWWNNVETKPGTGYPTLYEDQDKYRGGWVVDKGKLKLKATNRVKSFLNMFYNPDLPTMDDYYEPFTYRYSDLFNAPEGDDQPTARPISMVTDKYIDIEAGPNWDDDLSGSKISAENDPNLKHLSDEERLQLFSFDRLVFAYLPRICNHCLNPACVASCPSGAIYKRGEDGIVLINQKKCRGWRFCVSGCPYKKTYYNWHTGKSEKCILCYPRLETGQAPACFHSCVGRIRYLGLLFYDADRIEDCAKVPESEMMEAYWDLILDPFDPKVIDAVKKEGIPESWIIPAQKSPVYKYVKQWKIAFPLHPEFRTIPTLFYVPPTLPVRASYESGSYNIESKTFFSDPEQSRLPLSYMAKLFTGGNETIIRQAMKKLIALRLYERDKSVNDVDSAEAKKLFEDANLTPEQAQEIYRLTALATLEDRFVIPPIKREEAVEMLKPTHQHKGEAGVAFPVKIKRGL